MPATSSSPVQYDGAADIGPTIGGGRTGIFSTDVYSRLFIPVDGAKGKAPNHAFQFEGDWSYNYSKSGRVDGFSDAIFGAGMANRFGNIQLGTFAQFDYVSFDVYSGGKMLGAGTASIDYIFRGGYMGVFGSKGFLTHADLGSTATANLIAPSELRFDDQAGFHAAGSLGHHLDIESSVSYKKHYRVASRLIPSATMKLSMPVSSRVKVFVQADENATFQSMQTGYRVVFGIEFGHWVNPRELGSDSGAMPVNLPKPHYELLPR